MVDRDVEAMMNETTDPRPESKLSGFFAGWGCFGVIGGIAGSIINSAANPRAGQEEMLEGMLWGAGISTGLYFLGWTIYGATEGYNYLRYSGLFSRKKDLVLTQTNSLPSSTDVKTSVLEPSFSIPEKENPREGGCYFHGENCNCQQDGRSHCDNR